MLNFLIVSHSHNQDEKSLERKYGKLVHVSVVSKCVLIKLNLKNQKKMNDGIINGLKFVEYRPLLNDMKNL